MEFLTQLISLLRRLRVKHNRMELSQSSHTILSIPNYYPIFDNFNVEMCFKDVVVKCYQNTYLKNAFIFQEYTFFYSIYDLENETCSQANFRQIEGYCWP